MQVVYIDWVPVERKSSIYGGGSVKRHYAWITLNSRFNSIITFRKRNGNINWNAVLSMFKKDSKLWVEYPCGRVAHLFVLIASFVASKKIILDVNDFAIQQKFIDKEPMFFKRIQLRIIERLLLHRADVIILPWPKLLDYFKPVKNQKILIILPGVGEDELSAPPQYVNNKNIALYFGSMQRKGFIPRIIELFSDLKDWELHLVGPKEGAEFAEKENVKYLGAVSHDKLDDKIKNAKVILIPVPRNEYMDKAVFIKMGYALKSCRPVIATYLSGISEYVSKLGLEGNIIYVNEWNLESLKAALQKAQTLNIDPERTIEKLRPMAWEPRFKKAIEIAFGISPCSPGQIEWI